MSPTSPAWRPCVAYAIAVTGTPIGRSTNPQDRWAYPPSPLLTARPGQNRFNGLELSSCMKIGHLGVWVYLFVGGLFDDCVTCGAAERLPLTSPLSFHPGSPSACCVL